METIVVGVDGSKGGREALTYATALREADRTASERIHAVERLENGRGA
jgi:hypothetical protein